MFRLYRAYFQRDPEPGGYDYWSERVASGQSSLASISQTFSNSSEFRNTYGSLSDSGFIDLVYANVLGRVPDLSGRTYWVDRLAGGVGRGTVMVGFSESAEFQRRTNTLPPRPDRGPVARLLPSADRVGLAREQWRCAQPGILPRAGTLADWARARTSFDCLPHDTRLGFGGAIWIDGGLASVKFWFSGTSTERELLCFGGGRPSGPSLVAADAFEPPAHGGLTDLVVVEVAQFHSSDSAAAFLTWLARRPANNCGMVTTPASPPVVDHPVVQQDLLAIDPGYREQAVVEYVGRIGARLVRVELHGPAAAQSLELIARIVRAVPSAS